MIYMYICNDINYIYIYIYGDDEVDSGLTFISDQIKVSVTCKSSSQSVNLCQLHRFSMIFIDSLKTIEMEPVFHRGGGQLAGGFTFVLCLWRPWTGSDSTGSDWVSGTKTFRHGREKPRHWLTECSPQYPSIPLNCWHLCFVCFICFFLHSCICSCSGSFGWSFECLIVRLLGVFAERKSDSAPPLLPALLAAANPVAGAGADRAKAGTNGFMSSEEKTWSDSVQTCN